MKLKSLFLKLFIHINSFLWIIFLYILNNKIFLVNIDYIFEYKEYIFDFTQYNELMNIVLYLLIIFIMSLISVYLLKDIAKVSKELTITIKKINPIYREYLPVFLSIIIIALSLKNIQEYNIVFFNSIFVFLFVLFYMTKIGFLNPFYYILGIRIYKIETDKSEYILISNEKDYKFLSQQNKLKKIDEELLIHTKDTNG
ncbi:hypothetical protein [Sulfurospirillum sp. 1612]|uniref:hypothetical protein n=1 Tax=Sulfurospirillum sp. 1612 TaxID=3094835 RepID=UPI002F93A095